MTIRYVTVFRFFIVLIILANIVIWSTGGFILAWSFRGFFPPESGLVVGALACMVFLAREYQFYWKS